MKYYSQHLDVIDSEYLFLCAVCKIDENKKISQKQKAKALEFINNSAELYSDEDKLILCDDTVALEKKISYLKEKHDEFEKLKKLNDLQNIEVQKKIGADFEKAMIYIKDNFDNFSFVKKDTEINFCYIDSDALRKALVFHDAEIEGEATDFQSVNWYELSENEDKFCIEMAVATVEDLAYVKIVFKSLSSETEVFNTMDSSVTENPWIYLCSVAEDLILKRDLAFECMNDEEKDILPLAEALTQIHFSPKTASFAERITNEDSLMRFIQLAVTLGISDINLDNIKIGKINKTSLCDLKYEPLWRFIYDRFVSSQKCYPSKVESLHNKNELQKARKQITKTLKDAGFEGEYPNFYKTGSIIKPKALVSYDMDYVLAFEKCVVHHIKCIESYKERGSITFICGMMCLNPRKNSHTDAFSTMFNAKGKRCFQTLEFTFGEDEFGIEKMPSITEFAEVAVKKAMLEKLTKQERKNYYFSNNFTTGRMLLRTFLFFAIGFGILFTLGMMGFVLVFCWITLDSFSEAVTAMLDLPWLALGALAGLLFGGSMTLVFRLRNSK